MNPIDKYFINQKSFDEAVEDDAMFDIDFSSYERSINDNFPNDDEVISNEPSFENMFDNDGFQVPLPRQEYLNSYQDNDGFDKKDSIKEELPSIENEMNGFDQVELLIPELDIIGNTQYKIKDLFNKLKQDLSNIEESLNRREAEEAQDFSNLESILKFTSSKFDELSTISSD